MLKAAVAFISVLGMALQTPNLNSQTCTTRVELKFYSFADDPVPPMIGNLEPDPDKAQSFYRVTAEKMGEVDWQETAKHKYSAICLDSEHPDYFVLWNWIPRTRSPVSGTLGISVMVFPTGTNGCVFGPPPAFQTYEYGKDLERTTKKAFKETLQFLAGGGKRTPSPNSSCASAKDFIAAIEGVEKANASTQSDEKSDTRANDKAIAPIEPTAAVDISSTPSGAEIELDGSFVGTTPSLLDLSTGEHTIRITKKGYAAWERKSKITRGKISIAAELQRDPETTPQH